MAARNTNVAPIIALLLLPALYVLAYLALVDRRTGSFGARFPNYRIGGEFADTFFYPLELIDRRIRYWGPAGFIPSEPSSGAMHTV
jgi:hypothetical protein